MSEAQAIVTPRGRLVGGSFFKPTTTDFEGRPLTDAQGNPTQEYIMQVAFPKSDPLTQTIIDAVNRAASVRGNGTAYPSHAASYAFKIKDGDSTVPDLSGKTPNSKTGWAGHYVVTFKTRFTPNIFRIHGGQYVPMAEAEIKTGDYVKIAASFVDNGNARKPGLYANVNSALFDGPGEAIVSAGANPAAFFGTPAGAPSPTPTPVATPTPAPTPVATPTPAPVLNYAILQPPTPPTPPAGPQFTAAGAALGASYEALIASGWNDELLRANGYIV